MKVVGFFFSMRNGDHPWNSTELCIGLHGLRLLSIILTDYKHFLKKALVCREASQYYCV